MIDEKLKRCGTCGKQKPVGEFHQRVASIDGLAYRCKPCVNANSRKWREAHPRAHADWYKENKEHKSRYFKSWREDNKQDRARYMSEWGRRNGDLVAVKNATRIAAKHRATVRWADRVAIGRIYADARRLTRSTGIRHEVDHIVPLQGGIVTGLHWEANLRVITKHENISKHNRRWPDMPC